MRFWFCFQAHSHTIEGNGHTAPLEELRVAEVSEHGLEQQAMKSKLLKLLSPGAEMCAKNPSLHELVCEGGGTL